MGVVCSSDGEEEGEGEGAFEGQFVNGTSAVSCCDILMGMSWLEATTQRHRCL